MSRVQLAVYAGIGVALVLLGARAVRASGDDPAAHDAVRLAPGPAAAGARTTAKGGAGVVVHVAGAVGDPGVYRLPAGARVIDAIKRAGGARGDAARGAINLAAPLADGQQVVVPKRAPGGGGAGAGAGAGAGSEGPISLGSATEEDLEEIDGIGPVTAAAIIEYRDQHGGVASIEELDAVTGIGPATIEALSDRLTP